MGKTLVSLIAERQDFELVAGFDETRPATAAEVASADVIVASVVLMRI